MKKKFLPVCLLILAVAMTTGCRSSKPRTYEMNRIYRQELQRTENAVGLPPGSDAEAAAIKLFVDFYREYSTESIKAGVRKLYAEDAYFGDPFHGATGIDDIEEYFLRMAEPVIECTFDVEDWRRADNEYYFRWVMNLAVRPARNKPIEALGFSHVRFNEAGQVVFQQDYWDSSVLFDRLPVVGFFTRLVKRRLD